MRLSIQPGKSSDTKSLKLRVYPDASQIAWMETCCRARQWAYNLGTRLYQDAWRERKESLRQDPSGLTSMQKLPLVKRVGKNEVSRLITRFLVEVRAHQKQFEKQERWTIRHQAKLSKKAGQEVKLTPLELRMAYEAFFRAKGKEKENPWVTPHSYAWLLEVPRSVLTQGVNDYGLALSAKFDDLKKPRAERQGKGWPKTKPLHESDSFRVQLEKPATSHYLRAHWAENHIPLGAEEQGSAPYRDDLALPKKIPSLVTFSKSGSGKWHASFAVKESKGQEKGQCVSTLENRYQNPKRVAREKVKAVERKALIDFLSKEENIRAVGHDPNFDHWVSVDSEGTVLRALTPRQRREDRAKQAKADRAFSKTSQGVRPKKSWGIEGRPPSRRSQKAKEKSSALKEKSANITLDYQRKLANILGQFYARHHFEGTAHKRLRKTKRRGNAFAWSDTAPGQQVKLIKEVASRSHPEALFVTCSSSFASSQTCWNCKTKNPKVKDGRETWVCENPQCGMLHDRDECAGKNMLDEGFRISPQTDRNSPLGVDAKASRGLPQATPLGGWYCANQTEVSGSPDALPPFEKLLMERFKRCQLPVQVRTLPLPLACRKELQVRGGR